ALWNSVRQDYLVWTQLSNGPGVVDLFWYKNASSSMPPGDAPGVNTYRLFNCSLAQHTVSVWIKDATNGGPFAHMGYLDQQYGSPGCPASGSTPFVFHP